MYQEVVYTSLRCLPTDLSRPLRRGVDDILAKEISQRLGADIYVKNYPRESGLVRKLMEALSKNFGYSTLDWTVVFRRSPARVLKALAKSTLQLTPEFEKVLMKDTIDWQSEEMVETDTRLEKVLS